MLQVEELSVYGLEEAIRGMRNPLNSWDKSDSETIIHTDVDDGGNEVNWKYYRIGDADFSLMKRLCDAGEEHRKWMRMVVVYLDITAPLYWWKEFDTYKVGTVVNSCSTMHTIHKQAFSHGDFSDEQLLDEPIVNRYGQIVSSQACLDLTIDVLNTYRRKFIETKEKKYWWQLIQLLPDSYNQRRTVMINLEVCYKLCKQREGHKLDEWKTLTDFLRDKVVMLNDLLG